MDLQYEFILTMLNLSANARVVILRNSGHMGFIEEEKLAVKVVSDYVNSIS